MTVSGSVAQKAAAQVLPGDAIEVQGNGPKFVSRGGKKLAAALDGFDLDPNGVRGIDAGSSTGGFTDCLLQAGATQVVAIDVGTHQLHERIRSDERVVVREQTDIRSVDLDDIGGPAALVVADLSFISLRSVAKSLLELTADDGDVVILIKPQFEAGRQAVSKGRGIIGDPQIWSDVLFAARTAIDDAGGAMMGLMCSPIRGGSANAGNVEFLMHVQPVGARSSVSPVPGDLSHKAMIERVVLEAAQLTQTGPTQ